MLLLLPFFCTNSICMIACRIGIPYQSLHTFMSELICNLAATEHAASALYNCLLLSGHKCCHTPPPPLPSFPSTPCNRSSTGPLPGGGGGGGRGCYGSVHALQCALQPDRYVQSLSLKRTQQ